MVENTLFLNSKLYHRLIDYRLYLHFTSVKIYVKLI